MRLLYFVILVMPFCGAVTAQAIHAGLIGVDVGHCTEYNFPCNTKICGNHICTPGEWERMQQDQSAAQKGQQVEIPSWIKNMARWWSENKLSDDQFTKGLQYLIQNGIVTVPQANFVGISGNNTIPSWIKNNAGWWANGTISDDQFVMGIQYLVSEGIITVNSNSTATDQCSGLATPADRETCIEQAQKEEKIRDALEGAAPYPVGPVTFYYIGSQAQPAGSGKSILTLHFVVNDTSSQQVTMSCTNPSSCNYVLSDGQRNIPYATNTLVYGSLTLVPDTPTFVDWTYYDAFDTQGNYTFAINESWGTGLIPLKINW